MSDDGLLVEYACAHCPKVFRFTASGAKRSVEAEQEYKYFEAERRLHDAWHKLLIMSDLPFRQQP